MAGDAARSTSHRWCLYCFQTVRLGPGRIWVHIMERGPDVAKCEPLSATSKLAAPAPEGMRGRY